MKRIGSVVLTCAAVAAIGAGAALAVDGTPNPNQVASQICTGELHSMGVTAFKSLYAPDSKHQHAMRNCKRQHGHQAGNVVNNAAQQCKAEQADPSFADTHNDLTFDQFYGTNGKPGTNGAGKNAFGKCVSTKVHEALDQNEANLQNAAALCRAERADPGFAGDHGDKTFAQVYGTEKSKLKNAFGKCVSQKAKAQNNAPSV